MMDNKKSYLTTAYEAMQMELYITLLLSSVKGENETVNYSSAPYDMPFDIEVKNGISNLNIPRDFYVEIKSNLLFDTVERVGQKLLKLKAEERTSNIKGVVVVYKNSKFKVSYISSFLNDFSAKHNLEIRILSLDSLIQQVAEVNNSLYVDHDENVIKQPWETLRNKILHEAKEAVKHNKVSLFLGAGVSIDAGMVNWDKLLKELVNQKRKSQITKRDMTAIKDVNFDSSLIIGRYVKSSDSDIDIPKSVQKVLYKNVHQSNLIDSLCGFIDSGCVDSVITYNYDMLLEDRMKTSVPPARIKVSSVFGKNRIDKDCVPIYHVHGIVPDPSSGSSLIPDVVLTEDEYHNLYLNSYDWSNIEQLHALDRNVCFFIGLSMSDPNLRRMLDFSHKGQEDDKPSHYVFLERKHFGKSKTPNAAKDEENWRIQEKIYSEMGLNVIWFNSFTDLPRLIKKLY